MYSQIALLLCSLVGADAAPFKYEVENSIVYSNVDGRDLLLDAFVPSDVGSYPAVLVVHGGAWRYGSRKQLSGYARGLAKKGFVCFAIDYRLAPKDKFPAQIDDCRAALKWVRKNASKYKVDASRIGAMGYSAGGHLVTLLAATGEGPNANNGNVDMRLQAVAAGGAPTDFRRFADNGKWAEYLMGGDLSTVPEKFKSASTAAFVDKSDPPMFFFHGTKDKLVPLEWCRPCYDALKKVGVKTELFIVQDAGHRMAARSPEAIQRAYAFLESELKPVAQPSRP